MNIKSEFQRSLSSGKLHFAAHSHHPWPDCTREAQLKYWDDSAAFLDRKWISHVFSHEVPEARTHIARLLGLSNPGSLVEAPCTHEFVARLFSSFDTSKLRVLTTDSEFYSFERQMTRIKEIPGVSVTRVPMEPFESFEERLLAEEKNGYDVVFLSLVAFNTGFYASRILDYLSEAKAPHIILDGYHAFGALELNLSKVEDRVFFLAGGYKYVSAGEGACFLHVPANCKLRPVNTGWLAQYGALMEGLEKGVPYPIDGMRFAGGTYDPSGWYRFNAVMRMWQKHGLTPTTIHAHVRRLQRIFVDRFSVPPTGFEKREDWGNFLSFPISNVQRVVEALDERGTVVDSRDGSLRIGFGYYHDDSDVSRLLDQLKEVIRD